jgi:hypothetical protein
LLNDPDEASIEDVCIKPVSGSEAMIAMIHSAFSLDPTDRTMIVGNFRNVGQAIGEQVGIYSLQYPREHNRLADVRAAVIKSLEA